MEPLFITVEGLDGSGKSTQLRYASSWLEDQHGAAHHVTQEPGGTPLGDSIRSVFLDLKDEWSTVDGTVEALLIFASRRQHLLEVIDPTLAGTASTSCVIGSPIHPCLPGVWTGGGSWTPCAVWMMWLRVAGSPTGLYCSTCLRRWLEIGVTRPGAAGSQEAWIVWMRRAWSSTSGFDRGTWSWPRQSPSDSWSSTRRARSKGHAIRSMPH